MARGRGEYYKQSYGGGDDYGGRRYDRRDDYYNDRDGDRSRDYIPRSDNRSNSSNPRPRDDMTRSWRRRSRSPSRSYRPRSPSPRASYRRRDDDRADFQNTQYRRRDDDRTDFQNTQNRRRDDDRADFQNTQNRRRGDDDRTDFQNTQNRRRGSSSSSSRPDDQFAKPVLRKLDKSEESNQDKYDRLARQTTPEVEIVKEEVSIEERRKRREELKKKLALSDTSSMPPPPRPAPEQVEPADTITQQPISKVSAPQSATQDVDDMFASDDEMDLTVPAPVHADMTKPKASALPTAEIDKGLADNWDDPKGYYRFSKNEVLDQRYVLQDSHGLGKGMFSNVVRAEDKETGKLVAIKIIRNNDAMRKAAAKEIAILEKLEEHDPLDTKHIIRLHRSFMHKGHLCMAFENLSQDLRELLKKFGRDEGFDMTAVRVYARQLFLGLSLLHDCRIIHADLKPDNILVDEAPHKTIKICDLGSAFDCYEAGETPELASRFYRAPEVMLGIAYDCGIDMWSVGCTLFELYTGQILFTGDTNNQMLREIQECRGMFTERFVKQGSLAIEHFEPRPFMQFRSLEPDRLTGQVRAKLIAHIVPAPEQKLKARLLAATPELAQKPEAKPTYDEKLLLDKKTKEVSLLADLLEKCLQTNPEHRIKPMDALKHEFFGTPKAPILSGLSLGPKFIPRSQSNFRVVSDGKK